MAPQPQPTRERRLWWQIAGLLLLVCTLWALVLPPVTGPDEASNAVRAAAVARGEWVGDSLPQLNGDPHWANVMVKVHVPRSLAESAVVGDCYRGIPREAMFGSMAVVHRGSHCPWLTGNQHIVATTTYEHRGQPIWYFLEGLPTLVSTNSGGAFAMRMVGVVLCTAFLASALVSVLHLRNRRLAVLGALIALTPEVLYLASVQNSAGLEIATTLSLWASGLVLVSSAPTPHPLVRSGAPAGSTPPDGPELPGMSDQSDGPELPGMSDQSDGPGLPVGTEIPGVSGLPDGAGMSERRLVNRAGVALTVLMLTRGLSPAFAVLALVVMAMVARPGRRRELWRRRDVRLWLAAASAALVASMLWLGYIQAAFPLHGAETVGLSKALHRIPWWGQGMIAVFGSTDVVPPFVLDLAWVAAAVLVLGLATWRGSRRHVALALGLVVAGLALAVAGEGFGVPQIGFGWQGRYVLPVIIGAVLLAPAGARPRHAALSPAGNGATTLALPPDPGPNGAALDAVSPAEAGPDDAGADGEETRGFRGAGWLVIAVFVTVQVWCFAYAMRHYLVGHDGPRNPIHYLFDPVWRPPLLPPVVYLLLFAAGMTTLAVLLWRAAAPPAVDESAPVAAPAPQLVTASS